MIIYCLFIWTNLNPHHPRMLCANFGWNWPSGSREDENVKSLRQQQRRQWRRRKTDKFWSEKLTWSIGSVELKINNYFNPSMGLIRRWWTTIILSQMWQNNSVTDVPAIVVFFFWILPFIFLISLSLKLLDLELLLTVVMNIILIMLEYWHFPNYVKYTGWIWKNLKLIKLTQSIVSHMLYFLN